MEEDPQEKRSSIGNWLSALFFIFIFAGQPLIGFIRRATSGMSLPSGISVPMLLGGVVLVALIVGTVVMLGGRSRNSSDSRLPTSLPQQTSRSRRQEEYEFEPIFPNSMPTYMGDMTAPFPSGNLRSDTPIPDYTPHLPQPPSFEPIINGRVLMATIGIFVLFGAVYFVAQALFSALG
jgi:hypothetical protein